MPLYFNFQSCGTIYFPTPALVALLFLEGPSQHYDSLTLPLQTEHGRLLQESPPLTLLGWWVLLSSLLMLFLFIPSLSWCLIQWTLNSVESPSRP